MRSFTLKSATLTALLIAVSTAGAYARNSLGEPPTVIIDQAQGLDQGIADARKQNTITAAEAQKLHMLATHISQAAERTAAHGKISDEQYRQLLHQLDSLDQTLRSDTGSANDFYDGSDSGHYPNG
jgi:phage tail tape-measure protein